MSEFMRKMCSDSSEATAKKKGKLRFKIAMIAAVVVCAAVAFVIALDAVILPNIKYNTATDLMDEGKYEEAIAVFTALEGYKDSKEQIEACEIAILDGKYNDAMELYHNGQYEEAIAAFTDLDGYKDSAEKADSIYREYKLITAEVGDYVTFGTYEQDNDTSNGKEEIEWLVLDKQDGRMLVISRYALDSQPYNTEEGEVTWETCTLRTWLNHDFINAAFSDEEKSMIPIVTVSADKNPDYDTNPGKATKDRVFLLSETDVNKYFSSDSVRLCQPTAYAAAQGAYVADNGNCWWWLRTPGPYQSDAAAVYYGGSGYLCGSVNRDGGTVRPVMWIEFSTESHGAIEAYD